MVRREFLPALMDLYGPGCLHLISREKKQCLQTLPCDSHRRQLLTTLSGYYEAAVPIWKKLEAALPT